MVDAAACLPDGQGNPAIAEPAFVLVIDCFDLAFYILMLIEHRPGLQVMVKAAPGDFQKLQ